MRPMFGPSPGGKSLARAGACPRLHWIRTCSFPDSCQNSICQPTPGHWSGKCDVRAFPHYWDPASTSLFAKCVHLIHFSGEEET